MNIGPIVGGLPTTLALIVVSFLGGGVGAVGLFIMRSSANALVRGAARFIITAARGIPPIVWLFLIYFGLPSAGILLPAFWAASLGLSVIAAAYLAEAYRSGVLAVHGGQREAARALGMHPLTGHLVVVAPQAMRASVPTITTFLVGLAKDTAIASTIGVYEVTFRANDQSQMNSDVVGPYIVAGAIYLVLSVGVAMLGRALDRRLNPTVSQDVRHV